MAFYFTYVLIVFCATVCRVHARPGDIIPDEDINVEIIGGSEVNIRDYPYMASIMLPASGYPFCGGSIISSHYILTAAHCVHRRTKVAIRIGSTNSFQGGDVYYSESMKIYPLFNRSTLDYDVALIYVEERMNLDGILAQKVELIKSEQIVPENTFVKVTGWGATKERGNSVSTLRATTIHTISNEVCQEKMRSKYVTITPHMFCALVEEGGQDSCQGDSGGPVVSDGIQLGMVSFGYGCGRRDTPGVYANLGYSAIRTWIQKESGV